MATFHTNQKQYNMHFKILSKRLRTEFNQALSSFNPIKVVLFDKYIQSISKKDEINIYRYIKLISIFDKKLSDHLLSNYLFLKGNYIDSLKLVEDLLVSDQKNTCLIYLRIKILLNLNNKQQAFEILKNIPNFSKRKKTWLIWANIIDNPKDFEIFYSYWTKFNNSSNDLDLINYLVTACLRSKNYILAIKELEKYWNFLQCNYKKFVPKKNIKFKMNQENSAIALSQLKKIFDSNNIEFFLISGTLLGCIRENKILDHDYDLDVGIWEQNNIDDIISNIKKIGTFEILPIRSSNVLRIRHISNICIDIFIHKKVQNTIIHGGIKSIWKNSLFTLSPKKFLNNKYLIPSNYEKYLTENYGKDWRIPKYSFDSSIDTPNITIINNYEMIAYCYQKLFYNFMNNNTTAVKLYLNQIRLYSEKASL
jgi:hypothetical protein